MDYPRLSEKEYVILDQLRSGKKMYGLELVKESDGMLKRGTVYVTLNRMIEKGFLESHPEEKVTVPGLPRRRYSISGAGARALSAAQAAQMAAATFQPNGGW